MSRYAGEIAEGLTRGRYLEITRNEILTEWVKRLRSGEYQQGQIYLNRNGKYCCLGVLCEIATLEGIVHSTIDSSSGIVRYSGDIGLPEATILPYEVQRWAGVGGGGPLIDGDSLVSMNDSGVSFADIADVIEAGKVEVVFE